MNPATVACSALLSLSVLTLTSGAMAQTPQARPDAAIPSPTPQRPINSGHTNPNQAATPQSAPASRQTNPGQANPNQAAPGQAAPAQAAPAPGGRGTAAGRRPRASYASCNRQAHARGLRGGARRRFLIRCKLGYERPRQPQTAPARQP